MTTAPAPNVPCDPIGSEERPCPNLLDTYGDGVLPLRLDVTDHDAAVRAVAQAAETFGRIDVVVNSAGYSDLSSFEDTTIDSFRTQVETVFYGVVNVAETGSRVSDSAFSRTSRQRAAASGLRNP
ncbi:SDR family oxidoreductase [Actinomadura madurae]|uniref:SDR family oxidoreductase n=1 Tax=Actinomadura madurae TaxID=1993 RepID=UPI0020260855|nr:SDR family oxidoreductase [Actinomadura madurae]MCP9951277.1 SDR family oxidoreductase [Actinomadura madurae]MCP9968048.1 SDR family oxidoreductase [Actinomadura madurae]MCP9980507.1 SDR family oxidoreductase [Actinomadura madurae]MCQ0007979.1 SDR family oxidoreductase [Actinomadura madurae]MCQ0016705.1 SDR family oxidoreductase [Actinomadura madurae]